MRRKNMRRKHGSITEGNTGIQASVEVGYLYAGIEARLDAVAAAPGGKRTALVIAEGLGNLLLAKTNGLLLHDSQRVPQVRRGSPEGHEEPAPTAKVHVRPRRKRALSDGITCHACGNRFADQKTYMKHRYLAHPEIAAKQRQGLKRAMKLRRAA